MGLVKLIAPKDIGELALMKSLLDGNNISYFVHNEHFASLYGGATCVVMVSTLDFDRAATLLCGLLRDEEGEPSDCG